MVAEFSRSVWVSWLCWLQRPSASQFLQHDGIQHLESEIIKLLNNLTYLDISSSHISDSIHWANPDPEVDNTKDGNNGSNNNISSSSEALLNIQRSVEDPDSK